MRIEELKNEIEEQRRKNIKLFKSIPLATREDPLNKRADPILEEWREGSKILKSMIKELQKLEITDNKTNFIEKNNGKFVNGFGEATKRNITCTGYERAEKRNAQAILSFMGNR
ncbi:hypothetical protein WGM54_14115 [Paenibacillus polymyxa]|uniref:hypothetical protein n=1 Tax=Paenibacillus polymyxa TaxID=1406 RepID=UPI00307F1CA8